MQWRNSGEEYNGPRFSGERSDPLVTLVKPAKGENMACEKHRKTPARGYSQCEGCEVEMLQAENKLFRQALDDLGVTPAEAKAGALRSRARADKLSVYENGQFTTGTVRISMGDRGLLHINDIEVDGVANDVFDVVLIKRTSTESV